MLSRMFTACLAVAVLGLGAGPTAAKDAAAAEKAVRGQLARYKADAGRVQPIKDESLGRVLPNHHFFAVIFPRFPVARAVPEPLKPSNVFAVDADGEVKVLTDSLELAKYVTAAGLKARNEAEMKDAMRALLRLAQEFHQDGFYEFKLLDEATKVEDDKEGKKATGKVTVTKGGNGEIVATLVFDRRGVPLIWKEKPSLERGPRPRCHATKLLDPDPVVRAIVEDDLLIMGRAALPYLEEQRVKATPELRQAIDRVKQRILDRRR